MIDIYRQFLVYEEGKYSITRSEKNQFCVNCNVKGITYGLKENIITYKRAYNILRKYIDNNIIKGQ